MEFFAAISAAARATLQVLSIYNGTVKSANNLTRILSVIRHPNLSGLRRLQLPTMRKPDFGELKPLISAATPPAAMGARRLRGTTWARAVQLERVRVEGNSCSKSMCGWTSNFQQV